MKGEVNIDTEIGENCGTIVSGQNPGQNPVLDTPHRIQTTSSTTTSTTQFSTVVSNSTLQPAESNKQNTVIMATTVTSCFIVFILIYFVIIRPYLRRKAEEYSDRPIDTTRAPMDLEFRRPKKKNWFQDWFY